MGELQPECNVCNCNLTIFHILIECPKYEVKRKHFFGNYEVKMEDILERGTLQKIVNVIRFLKAINMYSEI